MKKKYILNGLSTALLLSAVAAQADEQYPASDFKPSVVYQDQEYIAKTPSAAPAANALAPAAKAPAARSSASPAADEKYPASDFKPSVVYNDPDYKHGSSISAKSTESASSATTKSTGGSSAGKAAEESSWSFYIGLVAFAVIGYFFFKKRPVSPQPAASASVKDAGGLTGVARYLNRKAGTGVARYLEKRAQHASATAATGVARYVSGQAAGKNANPAAKTGVEKYLRNRG